MKRFYFRGPIKNLDPQGFSENFAQPVSSRHEVLRTPLMYTAFSCTHTQHSTRAELDKHIYKIQSVQPGNMNINA